jgi:DUF4097 and DUF4098 domain-containing protein YvlB
MRRDVQMNKTMVLVTAIMFITGVSLFAKNIDDTQTESMRGIERIEISENNPTGIVVIDSMRTRYYVTQAPRDDILITLEGKVDANYGKALPKLEVRKSGSTLRIKIDKGSGLSILLIRSGEVTLNVYIPNKFKDYVDVNVSSARVSIGSINTKELAVNTSSGSISIEEFEGLKLSSTASSGDIEVQECETEHLYLEATSGRIEGKDMSATIGKIKSSSGDIRFDKLEGKIDISSSSGDTIIESSSGSMEIESSSGRVVLQDAKGSYSVDSSSGDILIDFMDNTGSVRADSSSGAIEIQDLDGSANISSTSGDIEVSFVEITGDCRFEASSGSIDLELPGKSDFQLRARTSSGRIVVDFPVTVSGEIKKDDITGVVGSGDYNLSANTTSGDIKIRRR